MDRFIESLPRPVYVGARFVYRLYQHIAWRLRKQRGADPFDFVSGLTYQSIITDIRLRPHQLLRIPAVRSRLALSRMQRLKALRGFTTADKSSNQITNATEYNLAALQTSSDLDRPVVMVNVAVSIQKISQRIGALDVLSIGPRSEIELFGIMAAGFDPKRIKALDLLSYSPLVETGDMHAMKFADNSFDVIFLGWVLAYSTTPAEAAKEIVRVCRNGAVVVATGDFNSSTATHADASQTFNNEETRINSVDQVLSFFGSAVDKVYFRHDPDPPAQPMVMTAFSVKKS